MSGANPGLVESVFDDAELLLPRASESLALTTR